MEPEKKSNGALIGLIVIIIILIVGGLYMWMPNTNQDSDELNTLEADIQATDTSTGVDVSAVE